MTSFQEFGKSVVYTMEYMELFDGKTLSDTIRHNETLCDGVCEGVIMVGTPESILEGDTNLNKHTIPSPS